MVEQKPPRTTCRIHCKQYIATRLATARTPRINTTGLFESSNQWLCQVFSTCLRGLAGEVKRDWSVIVPALSDGINVNLHVLWVVVLR